MHFRCLLALSILLKNVFRFRYYGNRAAAFCLGVAAPLSWSVRHDIAFLDLFQQRVAVPTSLRLWLAVLQFHLCKLQPYACRGLRCMPGRDGTRYTSLLAAAGTARRRTVAGGAYWAAREL